MTTADREFEPNLSTAGAKTIDVNDGRIADHDGCCSDDLRQPLLRVGKGLLSEPTVIHDVVGVVFSLFLYVYMYPTSGFADTNPRQSGTIQRPQRSPEVVS